MFLIPDSDESEDDWIAFAKAMGKTMVGFDEDAVDGE